jgi:RimJ/RimL family protein N-acetyltransferase
MHRWLNAPHVARWWYGDDASWRGVEEKYVPRIEGRDPVEPYVILHGDESIGYIQTYAISHDEEYSSLVGVEGSAGVDMFIGEAAYLYRGLGAQILRRFLPEVVFRHESVAVCVIGPEPKNLAAVRAYEKAGFRYFKTIQVSGEPEHLMRIGREEVLGV